MRSNVTSGSGRELSGGSPTGGRSNRKATGGYYEEVLVPFGAAANLTSAAHRAVLAAGTGLRCVADTDFSRFPDLRWRNTLA